MSAGLATSKIWGAPTSLVYISDLGKKFTSAKLSVINVYIPFREKGPRASIRRALQNLAIDGYQILLQVTDLHHTL